MFAEDPGPVKELAENLGIEFPLLADPDLAIIDEFGMAHRDALPDRDAARPGVLFVRPDGTIADARFADNYRFTMTAEKFRVGFRNAAESVTTE